MLHKALSVKPGVEMHHEFAVEITQKLGRAALFRFC